MFFNRLSFTERWGYQVSNQDAEQRAALMLDTLAGMPKKNLSFTPLQSPEDTWVGRWATGAEQKKGGNTYIADAGSKVVEVVDAKPYKIGWSRSKGDIISTERLVSVYDKQGGPGKKGAIFMRISPEYPPSVNVFTNTKDESNAGFIDKGVNAKSLKRAVRKLLHEIERSIPNPPWAQEAQTPTDT